MDTQYNLSNLEAGFKQYLFAVNGKTRINANMNNRDQHELTQNSGLNPVSIKNYLSDFRHFCGWLNSDSRGLKADFHGSDSRKSTQCESALVSAEILPLIQAISPNIISDYKNYLNSNNIPPKTINRRLSTLRKFGIFCISQGWMKENPFKKISNVQIQNPNQIQNSNESILEQYKEFLSQQNLNRQNINNLIADVEEFYQLTQTNL
ncbi:hypothetical protein COW98_04530 [Candidatus Roizmanbacteria bacterium CG22_combo_CG10-13_8_21_14_all_35_9]|uniref:Core-binding (CB) domain-containing protein n=1 Tax=Candidatus Roizmanbacteria bacterium CG22_combo_CG10-13_8_21_14_all_35_9 TaxID=1974861 RepID=A0A2H0BXT5_9BACT|nr:MAG: hypothetical protein COW98_04530 [Candidatus Roizmanbacteria bacterium CG22_combo_CG10-13_8_21_14_all_35_9]